MSTSLSSSSLLNQVLNILKKEDVKYEIYTLCNPIIDILFEKMYPYIYIIVLLVFLIFSMILAILILILKYIIFSRTIIFGKGCIGSCSVDN